MTENAEEQEKRSHSVLLDAYKRQLETATTIAAEAEIELLKGYAAANRKAAAGKPISSEDFTVAEKAYDGKPSPYNDIKKQINDDINVDLRHNDYKLGRALDTLNKSFDKQTAIDKWKGENPEITASALDIKNLTDGFTRQNIFPPKNLSLPEDVDTEEQLIKTLLKNNPGIAISDLHISRAGGNLIGKYMKAMKESGVDTIYTEMGSESTLNTSKIMLKLGIKLSGGILNDYLMRENAIKYGARGSDNHDLARYKMFLAAKENGIELVNIDKVYSRLDEDKVTNIAPDSRYQISHHRTATTNFIWTENIRNDRAENNKQGKYAVWGGAAHFERIGLVAKALGIPVINFDDREFSAKPHIAKGDDSYSADFYLPRGVCHPDMKEVAKLYDEYHKLLQNSTNATREVLNSFSKINDFKQLRCIDTDEILMKQPTQVSGLPPHSQSKLNK